MMCPGAHRIETAVVLTLGEVKGDAPLTEAIRNASRCTPKSIIPSKVASTPIKSSL